jgi:hypothetical protein
MNNSNKAVFRGECRGLESLFGLLLLARLLYPFFNSPLDHLFSDAQRHWDNGALFLHPGIMGSSDPYLYQAWIYLLRLIAHGDTAPVLLGCGILCAAMPYGWYRTLRELQPKRRALLGAVLIGSIPESISLYAYFMNETLLVALMGFCFWLTLRARRKRTLAAFAAAALVWTCAATTRTVALPMAAGCVAWAWAEQAQRLKAALTAAVIAAIVLVPAGLHARAKLGFFAPFGNLYFNEIYSVSGKRDIAVDYGADGRYQFGCPSFYNATFFPFSAWTTDRTGLVSIAIDLQHGRSAWIAEKTRVRAENTFPAWKARWENLLYLLFGQDWPNSDRHSVFGWLTLWTRWVWAPLIAVVSWGLGRGSYRGAACLLPVCSLGTLGLLLLQSEGVMEARFRVPIDSILIASALLLPRTRTRAPALEAVSGATGQVA